MDSEAAIRCLDEACSSGHAQPIAAPKLMQLFTKEDAASNSVTVYSNRLVNALPKLWGGKGGSATSEQLRNKQQRHNMLLQVLQAASLLDHLPAGVLRILFENGEKIAALTGLRELENRLLAERAHNELLPVQQAIGQAGADVKPENTDRIQAREDWEVFYSSPSQAAPAFFTAARQPAVLLDLQSAKSYRLLETLSQAVLAALAGASQQRAWQVQWFSSAIDRARQIRRPEWVAEASVREALLELGLRVVQCSALMQSEAPDQLQDASSLLLQLATPLLNGFAAAQAALGGSDSLEAEYAAAREKLLDPLLQQAMRWSESGDPAGQALLQSVETTAEAHRGYQQLFEIAEFMQDPDRLYSHMLSLQASDRGGSMGHYVFGRLRREGRLGELLSLPDDFNADLHSWLQQQGSEPSALRLRWLHELRIHRLEAAAGSLRELEAGLPADAALQDAARLSCLSKLATLAAQDPGARHLPPQADADVQADNAQLVLLGAQSEMGLGHVERMDAQALLEASVERHAQLAFDILAAAGHEFRKKNRALWEAAVEKLVSGGQWDKVHSVAQSTSEEEFTQMLSTTPVAQMAASCYGGAGLVSAGGSFAADFTAADALQILHQTAVSHCPAAADQVIAAFDLGHAL